MDVLNKLKAKLGEKIKAVDTPNPKRIYLTVEPADLKEAARVVFREMDARYVIASGIENFKNFEILYHFSLDKADTFVSLRVFLPRENPEVASLARLIPGVAYIEREMWELLGINFQGHPNLKRFLLPEDWPKGVYPLRKNV